MQRTTLLPPDPSLPRPVAGVDEAGRGPLAGPVVAAAVIWPDDARLDGLNDSKKLTAARRDRLVEGIHAGAIAWAIGEASEEEIDRINILQATFLAMRRALDGLGVRVGAVVVDGNREIPGWPTPQQAVVEGDGKIASIAAASILAKTHRDRRMRELDDLWPGYGFSVHMGYPTPLHLRALADRGPCPIHRKTFAPVRRILEELRMEL
jgi:ribonuclease HII